MKFIIHNGSDQIPQLVEQVGKFLAEQGVPAETVMTVSLCLEELLINTILYGYSDDETHEICIDINLLNGELIIEIVDDAVPFDPTQDVPTPDVVASVEERRIGGLGVYLVKNLTDSMQYTRQRHQNRLTLRKQVDQDTQV